VVAGNVRRVAEKKNILHAQCTRTSRASRSAMGWDGEGRGGGGGFQLAEVPRGPRPLISLTPFHISARPPPSSSIISSRPRRSGRGDGWPSFFIAGTRAPCINLNNVKPSARAALRDAARPDDSAIISHGAG